MGRNTGVRRTSESSRRYVLGDWGTSRLRLSLIEADTIVDHAAGPGIGMLREPALDTLTALIAGWNSGREPLEVVLCGMVGSRNGLVEVAYATLPVDRAAWARAAWHARIEGMSLTIAAGLCDGAHRGAPDVMRGEETQLFGALQLDDTLAAGSHLCVLPGTHSKWVEVHDGHVVALQTALTGELYALLRDHSILLKGSEPNDSAEDADAGFRVGTERCVQLPGGLLAALFEARTAQLLHGRSRAWASGFLSGLLIGYEVAHLGSRYASADAINVIGDPGLTSLYLRVFADFEIGARAIDGAECSIAGLRYLRDSRGVSIS